MEIVKNVKNMFVLIIVPLLITTQAYKEGLAREGIRAICGP